MFFIVYCAARCRGLDCLAVVEYLREKLQSDNDKVVLVRIAIPDCNIISEIFNFSFLYSGRYL